MELPISLAQHNMPNPGSPHRITVHRSGCIEIEVTLKLLFPVEVLTTHWLSLFFLFLLLT